MDEPFLVTTAFKGPLEEIQAGLPEGSCRRTQIAAILKHKFIPTLTSSTIRAIVTTKDLQIGNLSKLPIEVRMMIYDYLLVNPILGTIDSTVYYAELGLSPNLLLTCRGIYNEGMSVLYGQNKFYISCPRDGHRNYPQACVWESMSLPPSGCNICGEFNSWPDMHDHWAHCGHQTRGWDCNTFRSVFDLSPITRHWNHWDYPNGHVTLADIPAMAYVEHWTAVMACHDHEFGGWSAVGFCRAICRGQAKSLEVALIPSFNLVRQNNPEAGFVLQEILRPLRLLRNLRNLVIRPALQIDSYDTVPTGVTKADMPIEGEEDQLHQLVTGSSDVERAHEILPLLLAYAQTFERNMLFKLNMCRSLRTSSERIPEQLRSVLGSLSDHWNPFIEYGPVEAGLEAVHEIISDDEDSMIRFKGHTDDVLEHLGIQFKKICNARSAVINLIEQAKVLGGFFDAQGMGSSWVDHELLDGCAKILECYAETFKRQVVPEHIKEWSPYSTLEEIYSGMPRERAMARLRHAVATDNSYEFKRKFKIAFDDMDTQFRSICRTRKNLLDSNLLGQGVDKVSFFPSEEVRKEVDWSVNAHRK